MPPDTPYWGQAGTTYYLVIDGQLAGLLYWSDAAPGRLDGPEGEPTIVDPGWFFVPADDPDQHQALDAPAVHRDMTYDELAAAHQAALDAAQRAVTGWEVR